jgi:hypothetical protein
MEGLYRSMAILVAQPWLAAIPGAGLLALGAASRRRIALVAAVGWLLYVPYEYGMKWRILCSGECNIRVDLLALYPALAVLALLGLLAARAGARPDAALRAAFSPSRSRPAARRSRSPCRRRR